ncbi:MAG: branched-chain amino acid transport system II carrier protein [Firmicutes bacterium]|nr:branched-chain amino acid transport system II carrier protein [Bacillota bacterium]
MKRKDVIVTGFALFAMFFGAGNLIYPPFLGRFCAGTWFTGFICFMAADMGLAMMTLICIGKLDCDPLRLAEKLGKTASVLIPVVVAVCVGPMLAVPRTAAVSFEFAVRPFTEDLSPVIFSAVYFIITALLCLRQSRVIDVIGSLLAPALLLLLAVLVCVGIAEPVGPVAGAAGVESCVKMGISSGYQTMDVLAALLMSVGIFSGIRAKGYADEKSSLRMICLSGLIAVAALFAVYGGLAYLGATSSVVFADVDSQAELLTMIVDSLMGSGGLAVLGVIVLLACLTSAIGLVSSIAEFFCGLCGERLAYRYWVVIFSVLGCLISTMGLDQIIGLAAPILEIVYPVIVVLVFLRLFLPRAGRAVQLPAVVMAFAVSLAQFFGGFTDAFAFVPRLPLAELGFAWLIPAAAGGIIGSAFGRLQKGRS